jgi:hypothetical protein
VGGRKLRKREHERVKVGDVLFCNYPTVEQNVEIKGICREGILGAHPLFVIETPKFTGALTHRFFRSIVAKGGK